MDTESRGKVSYDINPFSDDRTYAYRMDGELIEETNVGPHEYYKRYEELDGLPIVELLNQASSSALARALLKRKTEL